MNIIDYTDIINEIIHDSTELNAHLAHNRYACKRKYDQLVSNTSANNSLDGSAVLQRLYKALDSFGLTRTSGQRRFHDEFIKASLPHIYGKQFENNKERIMKEFGMNKMAQEVLICTPRRFGKTTSCAMFCAAMALEVPNIHISIFSTGQRASSMLLDQTAGMVNAVDGGKERIYKKNTEQLFLKGDNPADLRRIYSYPSSVQVRPPCINACFCLHLSAIVQIRRSFPKHPINFKSI